MLTYQVTTAATTSIVTLSDIKAALYIDTNDDDVLIQRLIDTAEKYVGDWTQRTLATQTIVVYLDDFPANGIIRPPVSPIQSITSITYLDELSAAQTYTTFQSDLVTEPARIVPGLNGSFPSTDGSLNNVAITLVAGYADIATMRKRKQELEQGVMILVGLWYENRESAIDIQLHEIPDGIKNLLGLSDVGTMH